MNSISEEIKNWDAALERFEAELKLPPIQAPGDSQELEEYLTMDRDILLKINKDGRLEIAFRLQQYSFYVLRTINKNKARLNKLKRILNSYSAGKLNQYAKGYITHEEKLHCFINDDEYATRIFDVMSQIEERLDRLDGITKSLDNLAYYMRSLSYNGDNKNAQG